MRDLPEESRLVQEEQFGPVLPVLRYSSIEDALARVNDSRFGLAGSVWTADAERGAEVARKIDSGLVWVNMHMASEPDVPFGGSKQSGIGVEFGEEGFAEFTQMHIVQIAK